MNILDKGKKDEDEIQNEIKKIVSKIARVDLNNIKDNVLIQEELGIDSLIGIEIIANIETLFDIEVEESILLNMNTVGDFVKIIEKRLMIKNKRDWLKEG